MTDFHAFLRSLGLMPRELVADGRWRRCPTENHPKKWNGSYKLTVDGRLGFAQDWSVMDEPALWHASGHSRLPDVDVGALRRSAEEARVARTIATAEARRFYGECKPLVGGHPYLTAHGLDMTGCSGLRVDTPGWLVVPAWKEGVMVSLQRISPDGEKRFWHGASVTGSCYVIERQRAPVMVMCEGLATGLACFRALPTCRVLVAWNAGNLPKLPGPTTGLVVIAADNDHETAVRTGKNPGIESATQAASNIGCGVAYPEGIRGTDWADYRMERVAARVAKRYDGRPTVAQINRTVDDEIASALMRQARFT